MDGIILYTAWFIGSLWAIDTIRCIYQHIKHERNVTRLDHEYNTPDNIIDHNRRRIESMANDQENKAYGQHN